MFPAVAKDSSEGELHPIVKANVGKPRRLVVIRQANHPRACYLNGRRYAATSQLPLSPGSLIAPIGSYPATVGYQADVDGPLTMAARYAFPVPYQP